MKKIFLLSLLLVLSFETSASAAGLCANVYGAARRWTGALAERPRLIVLSAPSGGGKTTLMKMLIAEFPEDFGFSVSTTTRAPRPGEVDGKDYHYTNTKEFQDRISRGEFLEWAQVHTNFYGTSKQSVDNILKTGKSVILVVDVQGAAAIRAVMPGQTVTMFVTPPSLAVLEQRLRARNTDSEAVIQGRLANAAKEMARSSEFDGVIINDDLQTAYNDMKNFLKSLPQNPQ